MNEKVRREVLDAYADCHDSEPDGSLIMDAMERRNLNFRASEAVTPAEAKEILALQDGYNEFGSELLERFPKTASIYIAREGSVCLYAVGKRLPSADTVSADERDVTENGEVRYWWD